MSCGTSAAAEAGEPTEMDTLPGIPVSCGGNMVAPPAVVTAAAVVVAVVCVAGCACDWGIVTNCICLPSLDNLMVVVSAEDAAGAAAGVD